ncbi:MAG TPA: hypothetical protein DCZ95_13655 [Verrucomicrobia bacterium]|nr:MAG: hypothetical protein A2X46_19225 [Lentisphaerae bacterium GWF2_57_35]HBA85130.1 hypothetical protein [Verrucomicrobiota bacterium]
MRTFRRNIDFKGGNLRDAGLNEGGRFASRIGHDESLGVLNGQSFDDGPTQAVRLAFLSPSPDGEAKNQHQLQEANALHENSLLKTATTKPDVLIRFIIQKVKID